MSAKVTESMGESMGVPPTDVARIAAEAVRMDALVAALAAECAKGEARDGRVSCRTLRRLLNNAREREQ